LGVELGRSLVAGLTIGLIGSLGAGKTHFVKGIAEGNGEKDPRKVTSPTFTLIQEYTGRFVVYHIDAYRLRGPAELFALGFEELVRPETIVVVEWADRVRSAIPADRLWIEIEVLGPVERSFTFTAESRIATACWENFSRTTS